MSPQAQCRFCKAVLKHTMVDLGMSPLCESFLLPDQLNQMEPFYPLQVQVCDRCFLVQLEEYVGPASIFTEYAYFSSYSASWLRHAQEYVESMVRRYGIGARKQVVEVASNDGYLLQYFVKRGVPALGIEPAENVARAALDKGVPTMTRFFGEQVAQELAADGRRADLLIGNNVLAQVPDLNDFVRGMKILLAPGGVITMEFPHVVRLIEGNQFDTIYHEHFSYFSLHTVERIFSRHGLRIFDVEELETHGGSLRIHAAHHEDGTRGEEERLSRLREREQAEGIAGTAYYEAFSERVKETKRSILTLLIDLKQQGKRVCGYGAPGKGNTLLNYCGIRTDFLDFTCDRNPYKHGRFTPGTHIPIFPEEKLIEARPDYVFILPWNIRAEIMEQLDYVRRWGGKFIVPIPEAKVWP